MMRPALLACILLLLACTAIGTAHDVHPAAAARHLPLLDGGFWQVGPGLSGKMTDAQLAEEVGHMKNLGMSVIIIQYTASHYDHDAGTYYAYVPGLNLPLHPGLEGRDPVGAIMAAAEREGVRVILGGLLMPLPREVNYEENLRIWTGEEANAYRVGVIEKFAGYKCFVGWYTPNEPNPAAFAEKGCDPRLLLDATKQVTSLVKQTKPDLGIVMSIGLYNGPAVGQLATREHLDAFWRPFVRELDAVDAWMVIDGVGTKLSTLEHTAMAQEWAAALAREHGKAFWVDVENAHMGAQYGPMTMEEFEASLEVAARQGSQLITFDYAHYMSLNSPDPKAVQLHNEYAKYRAQVLGAQMHTNTHE